jgi:hypothetical protein
LNESLALLHQIPVVAVRTIPFQKGKLREVLPSPFSFSPAPADLKDLLISRGEHALHTKFRRSVQKPFTRRDSIDIGFWSRGWNPMRGFYFQITPIDKKFPDAL